MKLPDLPSAGSYGCILADPPWQFTTYSDKGRGRCPDGGRWRGHRSKANDPARHYETMSLKQIEELPVWNLAGRDCVLLLWAVDSMLPQAMSVGHRWGFTYKTVGFYWAKMRRESSSRHLLHDDEDHKVFPIGTGYWTRANPETCLLFTKGKPRRLSAGVRKLIVTPRREHSRKPDEQYESIERLVAGPYCELFARRRRLGWDSWGNQTERFSGARA